MERNVNIVKKSKEEKKVLRKQLKASHTLLKHEGISTAPQPTKVNRKHRSRKYNRKFSKNTESQKFITLKEQQCTCTINRSYIVFIKENKNVLV